MLLTLLFVGARANRAIDVKPSYSGDTKKHSSTTVNAKFVIIIAYVSANKSINSIIFSALCNIVSK